MDAAGTISYSRNADTPFIAASLYKLVLLADVYRRIEDGELRLTNQVQLLPDYFPEPTDLQDSYFLQDSIGATVTVNEALFATGAYSSNVAAKALLTLTDANALQATAETIGLDHSYFFVDPSDLPDWPPPDGDDTSAADVSTAVAFVEQQAGEDPVMLTTPRDMAIYFQRLLAGEIIDGDASSAIFAILSRQAVDDRFPVLLPSGTALTHKTGNLDHVVHDVGVIFVPTGPVILAAMCEDLPDDARATEVIQQLALIAYDSGLRTED
jgi:beta-lactamase class A